VQVFKVLRRENINVQMMSQGASKVNISLVVDQAQGQHAVRALHAEFFDGMDADSLNNQHA
jgi:aspartate kinase